MKIFKEDIVAIVIGLILASVLILSGCARKTPVEQAFDSIGQSVATLEQSLPTECKTDAVMTKIANLQTENAKAKATCETKIQDYKIKYERVLTLLTIIILAFFAKFFIKK